MPTIAVDGPAASGKGTLARRLAEHFGFHHLDTGLLYRAVGLRSGDGAPAPAVAAATAFDPAWLTDPALRSETASRLASVVGAIPEVRAHLLAFQRAFAARAPGAVLDGRDIGTAVCPGAEAKLYVTADVAVRARRRLNELLGHGREAIYATVLQDLIDRDARDSQRAAAPMRCAADALLLDTSDLDADAAFAAALALVEARLGSRRP